MIFPLPTKPWEGILSDGFTIVGALTFAVFASVIVGGFWWGILRLNKVKVPWYVPSLIVLATIVTALVVPFFGILLAMGLLAWLANQLCDEENSRGVIDSIWETAVAVFLVFLAKAWFWS
jgi:hypothetical protein